MRGLQLARLRTLDLGTLQVRNVPVLVKSPALRGMPKREGESFSPLAIGMSMMIDYEKRIAHHRQPLAGRRTPTTGCRCACNRLAMVRGLLNERHPAYFVVDTGGEVISISADTARHLPPSRTGGFRYGVGHLRLGSRRVPAAGRESRLRPPRVPQFPAGRPEPARAQPAARLPARRHRRPQISGALSRLHGSDAESELRLQKF